MQVHLEVRKDAGARGYCTLRSQAANGDEVGRADFRFDQHATRIDKVVTLRTTPGGRRPSCSAATPAEGRLRPEYVGPDLR